MKDVPSPNFNDRDADIALDSIVLHYTGMKDAASAVARLCDPEAKVSAHYVVDEDGSVSRLVDEAKRAWHAGKSMWRGITDMNSASIGIELVNPGHEFGYRPFPKAQIEAVKALIREIIARHHMEAEAALLGHSDIAPTRKKDPGEFFPWQSLAQEGLGLWPVLAAQDYASSDEDDVDEMLCAIGYDTSDLEAALLAFQRRFFPDNMTGVADKETVARLRAIMRLAYD